MNPTDMRAVLVDALGGEEAIPDNATLLDIATAAAQTIKQYRNGLEAAGRIINRLKTGES